MLRRCIIIVLLLASFCSFVLADESNGNIDVKITKLDQDFTDIVFVVVGAVVVLAVLFSVILIMRRRPAKRLPKLDIRLKSESEQELRGEGYYAAVFAGPTPEVAIADERPAVRMEMPDTSGIERYLKEDERIVVNVLRMKHGSCTQATLRVVTDFSKARLSRILTELEARGIIYKEEQGRKNLITLRT